MEVVIGMFRDPIKALIAWFAKGLNKISGGRISPDAVTIFGFAAHLPIAVLIATRHNIWAAALLVVFGLFDSMDGALARLQNRASAHGTMLDSATDKMKEVMLYTALAYAIIGDTGRPYLAVWAVAACGCSLLVSYINAQGDAVMAKYKINKHESNKSFRGGLFPFEVRMFVLVAGLLSDRLALAAIVITVGAAYTAVGRLIRVFDRLGQS